MSTFYCIKYKFIPNKFFRISGEYKNFVACIVATKHAMKCICVALKQSFERHFLKEICSAIYLCIVENEKY